MSDHKNRGARDGARIHLDQNVETHAWAKNFGVTQEQLKEAVYSVGDQADKVEKYLRQVYGDTR
jgi:hypothetical protein